MTQSRRTNNVYSGPNALKDYYNPDVQPMIPLVEVPESLNPLYQDGVRTYAKMMTMLPAHNVKALPALNMLSHVDAEKTKSLVEYSSGSTVISMSIIARILHGIYDTRAYLSNKTAEGRLRLMQFFGLDITLFGGPSQPEPCDPRGGIQVAHGQARKRQDLCNLNQYENDGNWQAHVRWTGPQILEQLPEVSVVCAGMGTAGTMTGIGTYFGQAKPSVVRLGVNTAPGDRVPGPRSLALMAPVLFPWREAIDSREDVGSEESFYVSMQLSREGIVCGPSSGFNLQGLNQFLEKRKATDSLESLRSEDGLIHCVFLCCDLPYQYIDEYFGKLSPEAFPKIVNHHLTKVDLYRYDDAWELSPSAALDLLRNPNLSNEPTTTITTILDLRRSSDSKSSSFPNTINIPLSSLDPHTISPFSNPQTLESQWRELDTTFSENSASLSLLKKDQSSASILVICYNGDTARVATSVLRARGISAYSLGGGTNALDKSNPLLVPGGEQEQQQREQGILIINNRKRRASTAAPREDEYAHTLAETTRSHSVKGNVEVF